jgi:uncharacterized protein (DUF2147 family)
MRVLKSALAAAALLAAGMSGAQAIEGTWLRGDGNARVRIAPCGDKVCATNHVDRRHQFSGEEVGDRLVMTLAPEGRRPARRHRLRSRSASRSYNDRHHVQRRPD